MSTDKQVFGARLRAAREAPPYWSRATLARLLRSAADPSELPDVAHVDSLADMIKQWEAGKHAPGRRYRPLYAKVTGIAEAELFGPARSDEAEMLGDGRASEPVAKDDWEEVTKLLRRTFLKHGIATIGLPAVGLAELQHVTAALDDARRYADAAVVGYFTDQLDSIAALDRAQGPASGVSAILGLIGAAERISAEAKPAIRLQLMRVLSTAAELTAWFYRDLAANEPGSYWLDRAMEWAQAAGDLPMQGYLLLKKSQAAWDSRDGLRMLTLAEATQNGPWNLPIKVRAEAAQQVARGKAMLGAGTGAVEPQINLARDLISRTDGTESSLSPHYGDALFEVQVAHTLALTGQAERALAVYDQWLTPQTFGRRDYGYRLAWKAAVHADAGDADSAAKTGLDALTIARDTDSARTHAALVRLTGDLRPHWHRPEVQEFRDAMLS